MQSTIEIVLDSLPAERGLRVIARSLEDIGESADRQAPAFRRLSGELARIERQARPMANALRTAAEGIQRGFSDAFTTIFRDGRLRFDDLADSLKNAFARLLGEMAALAVARPIIVPVVAGIGSLLGLPGSAVAGVTSRLGGGGSFGIPDVFGLGRALGGLFGATSVGLGGGATAASLGVSAVAGGMSNAGIATAGSLAGIGSALSFALPIAGLVAPLLLGGLFAGKPSDRTASLQGMLSDGLRPSEDAADGETRALRDQLGQMVGEALAAVSRATGQRPPDDLYLDLAAGNRDGLRFWLYETAEDLFGKPASVRPEALASGRYDEPQALVAGLVEALTGAMTGTAMSLQEVLARNFADDARRMADGIPDALDQVIDRFRSLKGTAEDLAAKGLIDLDAVLGDLKTVRARDLGAALAGLDAAALQAVITYYSTVERNTPILHAAEEALRAMGQASDGLAASLGTAQRRFVESQIAAARDYLGEMERQAVEWRRLAGSLQQTRLGLLIDPELSPLSPADRLAEARRQFEEVAARAGIGDQAAIDSLPDTSRRLLEASRAYYASSAGYFQDFERVSAVLTASESLAQRQLALAESQLGTLRQQLDAIQALLGGQQSMVQSLASVQAALQGVAAGLAALGAGGGSGGGASAGGVSYLPGSYGETASAGEYMAEIGLTRSTRDAILGSLGQSSAGGGVVRDRIASDAAFADAYRAAILAAGGVPNFALGGWHAGGLRLVGERGPELEATGPSRIFTAADTRRLLAPDSGEGGREVAGEIVELRRQQAREAEQAQAGLHALRGEMADIRQNLSRLIAAR